MPRTKESTPTKDRANGVHEGGDTDAEAVVLSVRMTRKQLELLDVVAGLYGRTKTDIAREGILELVHRLSSRDALEAQAERYRQGLMDEYDRVSARLEELSVVA